MELCPCNSTKIYEKCCQPFLNNKNIPQTPEELMRSRFVAFSRHHKQYLLDTWHDSTRPKALELEQSLKWLSLQIITTSLNKNSGMVEFRATFIQENSIGTLHETSRFIRENKHWFYVDGDQHQPKQGKTGRNDPCPCGSGRKFKKCCG